MVLATETKMDITKKETPEMTARRLLKVLAKDRAIEAARFAARPGTRYPLRHKVHYSRAAELIEMGAV